MVVLFSLGEALEGFATDRARGALEGLLGLAPPIALRFGPDGKAAEVPVEALSVGDRVLIRPGDRVSVDGVVRSGLSAGIRPRSPRECAVDKAPGDECSRHHNASGAREVEVRGVRTRTPSAVWCSSCARPSPQAARAAVCRRFARVYTPFVPGSP